MSTEIKEWRKRLAGDPAGPLAVAAAADAEIADLRAALALAQAPSAPVAQDEQKVELMRSGLALMVELKKVKADHAKVLEDAYGTLLWLHRRLPAAYKPLATVDQTIESIGRSIGYDAKTDLAERAALSVQAEPVASVEATRKRLMFAAVDCGHTITGDSITLYRDSSKDGNALHQLVERIVLAAAPTPPTTGEA